MLLSQPNTGPEIGSNGSLLMRFISVAKASVLWIGGIVFALLAAIGTFFFAMAAIIGTFVLATIIALAWFVFKWLGTKSFSSKSFGPMNQNPDGPTILDARKGPKGWTVNGRNPFER